jgi:hypothetical protein
MGAGPAGFVSAAFEDFPPPKSFAKKPPPAADFPATAFAGAAGFAEGLGGSGADLAVDGLAAAGFVADGFIEEVFPGTVLSGNGTRGPSAPGFF